MSIQETLKARGTKYGPFEEHGRIEQNLKAALKDCQNWSSMRSDAKSALEMIVHKIARILNGDPDYDDNWHDIGGYALLVEQRIANEKEKSSGEGASITSITA